MNIITRTFDPISLFESSCTGSDEKMLKHFSLMIKHLYQYKIFQLILDLTASRIYDKVLTFRLHDQRFFDLDEGNCKTIYGNTINKLFNKVRTQNIYQITIKKLSYEVIIHEIAHMIEKEMKIDLKQFINTINYDLSNKPISIGLHHKIEQTLITELKAYPANQRDSEMFARYFQILCASKEISGNNSDFYSIKQALDYFKETTQLINTLYDNVMLYSIYPDITRISSNFIIDISKVHHKWSEQKVQSIHIGKTAKWSNAVKSIKSDTF